MVSYSNTYRTVSSHHRQMMDMLMSIDVPSPADVVGAQSDCETDPMTASVDSGSSGRGRRLASDEPLRTRVCDRCILCVSLVQ